MKSKYKNLINVDYSGNNLYNLSRLIGNEFSLETINSDPRENINEKRTVDLLITTAGDSEHSKGNLNRAAGNLLLRAGVAKKGSGYVHLYSGVITEPKGDGTHPESRGILLQPDSNIYISSDEANVRIGALKDSVLVGQERVILSNHRLGEGLVPVTNYISLLKTFTGSAPTRSGEAIVAVTPNLDITYNNSVKITNLGDNTTFDLAVDKLNIESSYKVTNSTTASAPAYKLSITDTNKSSVLINDITSYGTVTGLNLKLSGDFNFDNNYTFNSDGIEASKTRTYDRFFNAYGKELFEEFKTINIRLKDSSITDASEQLGTATGVFALTANLDKIGKQASYSKMLIQYIEALNDLQVWGNVTFGKTGARKKVEIYSSDLDITSNDTLETHTKYQVNAGTIEEGSVYPYILDVNTDSELTVDILNTRKVIHANSSSPDGIALDVNNKSTFDNYIILDGSGKGVIKSDGTTNKDIKINAQDNLNLFQGNETTPDRSIKFNATNGIVVDSTDKIKLESDDLITIKTTDASSGINLSTPPTNGAVVINTGKISIYQDSNPDSNFNLKVLSSTESSLKIKDINTTGKITINDSEINGDFTFQPGSDAIKEDFILIGDEYSSNFNYIDENVDTGVFRLVAYNTKPTDTLDKALPTYPAGLSDSQDSNYSLIQVQNIINDQYAWMKGIIDIHPDNYATDGKSTSIYTNDYNLRANSSETYTNEIHVYSGYTLPTDITGNTEIIDVFGSLKTDASESEALAFNSGKPTYILNVNSTKADLYLTNLKAQTDIHSLGTLKVNSKSTLHDVDLIDDDRTIDLTTANKTLTISADNLSIKTHEATQHEFIKLEKTNKKATFAGDQLSVSFGSGNKAISLSTEDTSLVNAYNLTARNHVETLTLKAATSLTTPDATVSTHLKSNVETTFQGTVHSNGTLEEFNIESTKGVITFGGDNLQINTEGTYTEVVDTINITTKAELDSGVTFNVNCAENLNNTLNMQAANGIIQAAQGSGDKAITIQANKFYIKDSSGTYNPITVTSATNKADITIKTSDSGTLNITSNKLTIATTSEGSSIDVVTLTADSGTLDDFNIGTLDITGKLTLAGTSTFESTATSFDVSGAIVNYNKNTSFEVSGNNDLKITDKDSSSSVTAKNINANVKGTFASAQVEGTSIFDDAITLSASDAGKHTINGTTGIKLVQSDESIYLNNGKITVDATTFELSSGTGTSGLTKDTVAKTGLWIGHLSETSKIIAYNGVVNTLDAVQSNITNLDVSGTTKLKGTSTDITSSNVAIGTTDTKVTSYDSYANSSTNVYENLYSVNAGKPNINTPGEYSYILSIEKSSSSYTSSLKLDNITTRKKIVVSNTTDTDSDLSLDISGLSKLNRVNITKEVADASTGYTLNLDAATSRLTAKNLTTRLNKFVVNKDNSIKNFEVITGSSGEGSSAINVNTGKININSGTSINNIRINTNHDPDDDFNGINGSYMYSHKQRTEYMVANNVNILDTLEVQGVNGFQIYWDPNINSMVFARGNL